MSDRTQTSTVRMGPCMKCDAIRPLKKNRCATCSREMLADRNSRAADRQRLLEAAAMCQESFFTSDEKLFLAKMRTTSNKLYEGTYKTTLLPLLDRCRRYIENLAVVPNPGQSSSADEGFDAMRETNLAARLQIAADKAEDNNRGTIERQQVLDELIKILVRAVERQEQVAAAMGQHVENIEALFADLLTPDPKEERTDANRTFNELADAAGVVL